MILLCPVRIPTSGLYSLPERRIPILKLSCKKIVLINVVRPIITSGACNQLE
jgi:hypothetical protein